MFTFPVNNPDVARILIAFGLEVCQLIGEHLGKSQPRVNDDLLVGKGRVELLEEHGPRDGEPISGLVVDLARATDQLVADSVLPEIQVRNQGVEEGVTDPAAINDELRRYPTPRLRVNQPQPRVPKRLVDEVLDLVVGRTELQTYDIPDRQGRDDNPPPARGLAGLGFSLHDRPGGEVLHLAEVNRQHDVMAPILPVPLKLGYIHGLHAPTP